jgi:hypothetical protein
MIAEVYKALSMSRKHTLKRKFISEFETDRSTFYRKVSGKVRLRKSEEAFFENNLPEYKERKQAIQADIDFSFNE